MGLGRLAALGGVVVFCCWVVWKEAAGAGGGGGVRGCDELTTIRGRARMVWGV